MNSLKLNRLSDQKLAEKQMNMVTGGQGEPSCYCCCGCLYEGQPGGSTSADNRAANGASGKWTAGCAVMKDGYIIN